MLARVARINPAAQAGTRAVMVYLAVDPQPGLRQGLFAKGRIELERRTASSVPATAVRIDQARPYVLAVEDGRVVQHGVELGLRADATARGDEALVEVNSGIADGSTVLRGTVGAVREGTRVRLPASGEAAAPATASASSGAATTR